MEVPSTMSILHHAVLGTLFGFRVSFSPKCVHCRFETGQINLGFDVPVKRFHMGLVHKEHRSIVYAAVRMCVYVCVWMCGSNQGVSVGGLELITACIGIDLFFFFFKKKALTCVTSLKCVTEANLGLRPNPFNFSSGKLREETSHFPS
jgi:hypothetical protein